MKNSILEIIKDNLIDCREKQQFINQHVRGSISLSLIDFEERAHEVIFNKFSSIFNNFFFQVACSCINPIFS